MNTLESQAPTQITRSTISDWVGDPIDASLVSAESMPNLDKTVPDYNQTTERLFDLTADIYEASEGLTISLSQDVRIFRPTRLLFARVLCPIMQQYASFSYDSLTVRFSVSDPKAVAGGCVMGWFPFTNWFSANITSFDELGELESDIRTKAVSSEANFQWLVNMSPQSTLISYGQSKDIEFTIPWQYPTTQRFRGQCWKPGNDPQLMPPSTGEPLLFLASLTSYNVSSVNFAPRLRIFVKFNNLRFMNPSYLEGFEAQSGVEPVLLGLGAEAIASAGEEILGDVSSAISDYLNPEEKAGTFEAPSSVQLSYAGDTTSMGPPQCSPIFSCVNDSQSAHKIIDYLRQPQYIGTVLTTATLETTNSFYSWPFNPRHLAEGPDPTTTWFNWFQQCTSFWRGTIFFDFAIQGHPLVEVAYKFTLTYPNDFYYTVASGTFSEAGTMEGIAKGPTVISVPMPFASYVEMISTHGMDNPFATIWDGTCPAACTAAFKVLSTMLDVTPTVPIRCFIRAGEDFKLYWPKPPGLWNCEVNTFAKTKVSKKKAKQVRPQVGLDLIPIVFQTRARDQAPLPESYHPLEFVEDFFRYWSRCLPFNSFDGNDEPLPEARYMGRPGIWKYDSAAWTSDVNNSWYITQDYLSMYSSMFLYYTGSIGIKAVASIRTVADEQAYLYVALQPQLNGLRPAHNPYTSNPLTYPPAANMGIGAVVTPAAAQPVLECTIPLLTGLTWQPCRRCDSDAITPGYLPSCQFEPVSSNLNLKDPETGDLMDALFRKGGADFGVRCSCHPPPPYLWQARGNDWS